MKLRTIFLILFSISCVPAVGWSAWIVTQAVYTWDDAASAVRSAEAMGNALHLIDAYSVERGALQERALSDKTGVQNLKQIEADNDDLFERARLSMRAAGIPDEVVTQAREVLVRTFPSDESATANLVM